MREWLAAGEDSAAAPATAPATTPATAPTTAAPVDGALESVETAPCGG